MSTEIKNEFIFTEKKKRRRQIDVKISESFVRLQAPHIKILRALDFRCEQTEEKNENEDQQCWPLDQLVVPGSIKLL